MNKIGKRKRICKYGHDTFICGRLSNHTCKLCVRWKSLVYYRKHKKKCHKAVVRLQCNNRKYYNDYILGWRTKNRKKLNLYNRKYYKIYRKNNPWLRDYMREYMKLYAKRG